MNFALLHKRIGLRFDTAGGSTGGAASGGGTGGATDPGAASGGGNGAAGGAGGGGAGAGSTTPPPAGAQATTGQGVGSDNWLATISSDELRGYTQNKGWKDPAAVVESYRGLEKLLGGGPESLIKLPKEADSPEWSTVFTKLGKPEKPEGYTIPVPQGRKADPEMVKWSQNAFHKANLTPKQAEALATEWNAQQMTVAAKAQADYDQMLIRDTNALKHEWGAAYDQNLNVAKNAAVKFGVKPEQIDALERVMGKAAVHKFFHGIGQGLGEHNFVEGGQGGGKGNGSAIPTPAQARAKIEELKSLSPSDPWMQRYLAGSKKEVAEMTALHEHAYPGQTA